MKNLILASLLALAATASVIAPTQAASVTIQSDDGNQYSPDDSDNGGIVIRRHHDRRYDNQYEDDQSVQYDNYGQYRRYHRHHRCHVETVVHWRHHHRVVEDVRVCG
ncbi:hypothetical protein FJ546_22565 [Mesorhizobium sp. B2-4-19]|uniref:hypothetical protein n=1 Tax=Mesorhizobium sp. B2-4-19 TaxID=2589930 RepID=UPI00112E52CB|nr:hypothetical protein [Mesorhizobium sp. B2-4-19]TPK58761.1 hypothetical protein FJ546_22565 [Mesorhizobium sp. B2-4-19]